MMKTICFFNSMNFWGGGEKLNLDYAIEFNKKEYSVLLVSHQNSPLWKRATSAGLKVYPITVGNLSFLNPFKILSLIRFFKNEAIDTVIFSNSQDVKLGSISAKFAGVKNIVYYRSIAVPIKGSFINRIIFKSMLSHVISNSDETKRKILQNLGTHINEDKIKTLYYGIDLNTLTPDNKGKLKEIQEKGHGVILGNAGRLTAQKGQKELIEIAKILKFRQLDFTLFIAGTGELKSELESLIEKHDLKKEVVLLGFVKEMGAFMNSLDIFLLTSKWEGFGYVLVEAMLKSKPVVAFDMTSNPEVVIADKTGFLVDYPDLNMFADKVSQLIQDDPLRNEMGKAGMDSACERFDLKERVLEFEHHLLEKNKHGLNTK